MLYLADDVTHIINRGELIPLVAIAGGLLVAIVGIIFGSMKSIYIARAREETKRELAAYVAEGTLDPEKAVAIINAGRAKGEVCKPEVRHVAVKSV
jgi:hypothetical protein